MRYRAKNNSVGFMERYWNEGDLTDDIPDGDERLNHSAMIHFEPVAEKQYEAGLPNNIGGQFMSHMTSQVADLNKKTVAELKLIAAQSGVEVPDGAKKADIINLLTESK